MHRLPFVLVLLLLLAGLCACGRYAPTALSHRFFGPSVLRVGVVADAPPLAYRKNGALTGLEVPAQLVGYQGEAASQNSTSNTSSALREV